MSSSLLDRRTLLAPLLAHDDATLVALARRGEPSAFETIMRRHNRLLFRTARGVLSDDAEAQDVVQETYLRALTRLDSFRGEAALGTWLARIAINLALDAQRRRGRTVPFDDGADGDEDTGPQTMEPGMHESDDASGQGAPEAALEKTQMRRLLRSAIDGLPPIYRSVFILRAVEELSVGETATSLGISAESVRTRYLRARSLLRDALGARIEAHAPDTYPFAGTRCDAVVAGVMAELRRRGFVAPG